MYSCNKSVFRLLTVLISHNNNSETLDFLNKYDVNFWNDFVKLASSQLLLPKIYSEIKKNNIESYIPDDLLNYLQEISEINYLRNKQILKQIFNVGDIFNKNKINYVFLKGSALLLSQPYDTINERMIGDIDILVSENDIHSADRILKNMGYYEISSEKTVFTKNISGYENKHLPRICHDNYIAAVELHRKLLRSNNNFLAPKQLLKNKQKVKTKYFIPSNIDLWRHAILNRQINDNTYYTNYLSFSTVLDVLSIEPENINSVVNLESKYIKHFYTLLSFFILIT